MRDLKAALETWLNLLTVLRDATEEECEVLLHLERKGKRRVNYMLRIYGRYNRLRSDRERRGILEAV